MFSPGFEAEEKKPISVGPWGGQNGQRWDDGVYTGVKQVVIAHGSGIDSIQIEYDRNGTSFWSLKHGGTGGSKVDKVKFDFPNEYLTSVHGFYGSLNQWGSVFVRSLTFVTNKKKHGPYGMEAGTHFSFPMTGGKIVGFHGKSGWYLDAVGVYLKPLQNPNNNNNNNVTTTTMVRPQNNLVMNGNDKLGFSMIQESVGQYGYDIVVAVRQKDDNGTNNGLGFQKRLARQDSFPKDHFNGVEFPNKVTSGPKIQLLEEVPQKIVAPLPQKLAAPLTFGPWGGNGGTSFDDGIHKGIRQIKLKRNVGIVSMRVMYDDGGEPKRGAKLGGTGSFKSDNIVFDYPSEILTHISGTMGSLMHMGPTCIKSLTFYTNKDKYGPFGEERGPSFTSKLKEGKIVGFHGRGGLFLDALGVHVVEGKVQPLVRPPKPTGVVPGDSKPVAPPPSRVDNGNSPWSNKLVAAKQGPSEEVYGGVVKEPAPCGPGPWGGDGGKLWDDGAYSGIRQIYVTRSDAICSIQIEYDKNGQPVWSAKHGGNGGTATHKIKLEYPHEVLVCISGYHGSIAKDERPNVVRSLTFHTSRGKYGPYGEEIGTYFTSTTTQGKAVGFHGRSSLYLDAIGVHMQHWLGNQKPAKQHLFRKGR